MVQYQWFCLSTYPVLALSIGYFLLLLYYRFNFSFFNWVFFCLHFKCFPLFRSSLWKPPIPSPVPLPLWGCSPLTYSYPPALAFPYNGALNTLRPEGHSSNWCPTRPSSTTYVGSTMGPSMCILWLVVFRNLKGGVGERWGREDSLHPARVSPMLWAVNIHICIGQVCTKGKSIFKPE